MLDMAEGPIAMSVDVVLVVAEVVAVAARSHALTYRLVPAQDVPFALIIWYIAKIIYLL